MSVDAKTAVPLALVTSVASVVLLSVRRVARTSQKNGCACSKGPPRAVTGPPVGFVTERAYLNRLLGMGSRSSLARLPLPVVDLIDSYRAAPEVKTCWRIRGAGQGDGPVRFKFPTRDHSSGFLTGDRVFSTGRHSWRVTVQTASPWCGPWIHLGVSTVYRQGANLDLTGFYGVGTCRARSFASQYIGDLGLPESALVPARKLRVVGISHGDTLEFLLDLDEGMLTVITLKNGKRQTFTDLPRHTHWVPCFFSDRLADDMISVELPG